MKLDLVKSDISLGLKIHKTNYAISVQRHLTIKFKENIALQLVLSEQVLSYPYAH